MLGKLLGLVKGRVLYYVVGLLGAIILGLLGTVYVQGKISNYKDFQIEQLEQDIVDAKLEGLVKAKEARTDQHKETTDEDINKTLSSKHIFTGHARL